MNKAQTRKVGRYAILYALLGIVLLWMLVPIVWMVLS
jgi:ABC-type glycerol-3-phosphate transport system permease component